MNTEKEIWYELWAQMIEGKISDDERVKKLKELGIYGKEQKHGDWRDLPATDI